MKMYFQKQKPHIIRYRNYKNFSNERFRYELTCRLQNIETSKKKLDDELENFHECAKSVLNKIAPLKKKYVRANQSPFMNRTLHKAVMKRSRLRNEYLKNRTEENKLAFNQQRNICVTLFRKEKYDYYNNLIVKKITDNKTFWKSIKPFLSDKGPSTQIITLIEKEEIISDDDKVANIFSTFFTNTVKNLDLTISETILVICSNVDDPVLKAIKRYENHPSILNIKKTMVMTILVFPSIMWKKLKSGKGYEI